VVAPAIWLIEGPRGAFAHAEKTAAPISAKLVTPAYWVSHLPSAVYFYLASRKQGRIPAALPIEA